MLPVLGDLLPYAVPVALSPLPLIAVVMLLLAPVGTRGGLAFLAARVAVLAAVTLLAALVAGGLTGRGSGTSGGWLRIAVGCLVILGAGVVWHRRPRQGAAAKQPGWMRSIEGATPARAAGLGALLTVANLKEISFGIGAGMLVGSADLPAGRALAMSLLFACVASLGTAAPVVWVLAVGARSRDGLQAAADWLVNNNAIVVAAVLVAVGAMLIGSGLEAL